MKPDQNLTNRLAYDNDKNTAGVETESNSPATGLQAKPLSLKGQASLSEQARLLAKARTVLDEADEWHAGKASALKAQVAEDAYQIPVNTLARLLVPQIKLYSQVCIEDDWLIWDTEQ